MPESAPKILLLGLGNDILTDDAIGLTVIRRLQPRYADSPAVALRETAEMGLALLDFMVGFQEVMIVDSIQTGEVPPGTLRELDASGLKTLTGRTPHFLGVGETLALGRRLGLEMPQRVRIFAIEVEDPLTLGTTLTATLEQALPGILNRVVEALTETVQGVGASPPTN